TVRTAAMARTAATARMVPGEKRGAQRTAGGGFVMVLARQLLNRGALVAALAFLAMGSPVGALIITGGPTYALPGGGSCSVSGVTANTGGATISCTGVNLGAHTKVYFGIRNASNVNGQSMTGTTPAAASPSVFRYLSNTSSAITYNSSTSINDVLNGATAVNSRLVLTLTAGSASVVAAGGNPANNNNGDIQAVFQINSGSSFTVRADVQASSAFFPSFGSANPNVYDPTHTSSGSGGDDSISRVDVAFYYSDCGDGVIDSPEQCDLGGANGAATSCCTSTCTFRSAGQACRVGGGSNCDLTETCTGSNAACPTDDAPINVGLVCRPGSGDICDANETCTGAPGQGCPADDAPTNTAVVCRVGSVGDFCDMSETCSGTPGATCPADDAPLKINQVCRPGSGDVCDPEERCTGFPGQGCPANVVANPSTVCRVGSGDSCDPSETCTAVPGQACPANVVTPAGTQCRAASGTCDVAEQCTGTAGLTCPANGFASSGTTCDADSSVCTNDECDGNNNCVFDSNLDCEDGNVCTQDSCDAQDGCGSVGQPSNSCTSASKASLKLGNSSNDAVDKVKFLWKGGPALLLDMGDPTQSTRYELCIYDSRGVQSAMGVPPGAGWSSKSTGYRFKDIAAQNDGISLIITKASNLDKAKLKIAGKGVELPDTAAMPLVGPVTAQVYASDGMCWEAEFAESSFRRNDTGRFIAKTP
ncbi:MAG: hypothetical protein ACRERC_24630, partial [Candidatus Binatia bacterium]